MPLLPNKLQKSLVQAFQNTSKTKVEAGDKWSKAFDEYMETIAPPSLTRELAKKAFLSKFMLIELGNGIILLPQCFEDYCAALAPGMAPTFTGTSPQKGQLNFLPVYAIGLTGASAEECAIMMTPLIDTWVRTGTAINNSSGVTIPWN